MSLILGITGGSGSGKTSFVNELKSKFSSDEVTVISQDDYYKSIEHQKVDKQGVVNFDLPKSIHLKQFARDIQLLTEGHVVTRQEYTFNNRDAQPTMITFNPSPIIIVEGLFILHDKKIKSLLDISILINARVTDKIVRRIIRDKNERNYPLDDVLYRYQHHVMPAFNKYIMPYKEDVDVIINNNKSFDNGLDIIVAFIKSKLI